MKKNRIGEGGGRERRGREYRKRIKSSKEQEDMKEAVKGITLPEMKEDEGEMQIMGGLKEKGESIQTEHIRKKDCLEWVTMGGALGEQNRKEEKVSKDGLF